MRKPKNGTLKSKKVRRGVFLLPSLLTTGNIFFGFYAIIASLDEKYYQAALAIIFSFLLDGLDGTIARLTKTESQFGLNLDSLADIISFGVGPAILAYTTFLHKFGGLGWGVTFFYLICGAVRLARFNTQKDRRKEHKYFVGLPIPVAAAFLASMIIFTSGKTDHHLLPATTLVFTFVIGFLMISTLRYKSFKEIDFKKKRSIKILFIIAISIIIIASLPQKIPFIICSIYILSPFFVTPLKRILSSFKELDNIYEKIDDHLEQ